MTAPGKYAAYPVEYAACSEVDISCTTVGAACSVVYAAYLMVNAAYLLDHAACTEVYAAYTFRDAACTLVYAACSTDNVAYTEADTAKQRELAAFGGIITAMASDLAAIVAALESRLAFHQEQARHHEEQKSRHEAEIETISRKLGTFKAALSEAESLPELGPLPGFPKIGAESSSADLVPGGKVYTARLVASVLADQPAGEPFGISTVTQEINRRYRDHLSKPIKPRQVSVVLRWMLRTGRIHAVQKGRPFHEALYTKG